MTTDALRLAADEFENTRVRSAPDAKVAYAALRSPAGTSSRSKRIRRGTETEEGYTGTISLSRRSESGRPPVKAGAGDSPTSTPTTYLEGRGWGSRRLARIYGFAWYSTLSGENEVILFRTLDGYPDASFGDAPCSRRALVPLTKRAIPSQTVLLSQARKTVDSPPHSPLPSPPAFTPCARLSAPPSAPPTSFSFHPPSPPLHTPHSTTSHTIPHS